MISQNMSQSFMIKSHDNPVYRQGRICPPPPPGSQPGRPDLAICKREPHGRTKPQA